MIPLGESHRQSGGTVGPKPAQDRSRRRTERLKPRSGKVGTPKGARSRNRSDVGAAPLPRASKRGPVGSAREPALSHEAVVPTTSEPFAGHFADLMKADPVAAFVKDADGHYLYANPLLLA